MSRSRRQGEGRLVERRQVVIGCRQELDADRRAAWRAGQTRALANQPLVVGGALTARRPPGRGMRSLMPASPRANRSLRTVDRTATNPPADAPPDAARAVQRPGPSAELAHHARCPLVMVLDAGGGARGDRDCVRGLAPVPARRSDDQAAPSCGYSPATLRSSIRRPSAPPV